MLEKEYIVVSIPLKNVEWEMNYRTGTDDVGDLMESVDRDGLIQHISVNIPKEQFKDVECITEAFLQNFVRQNKVEGVVGFRRDSSFRKLGRREIPARVYIGLTEAEKIIFNINENLRRKPISIRALSIAFDRLEKQGFKQNEVRKVLGISPSLYKKVKRLMNEELSIDILDKIVLKKYSKEVGEPGKQTIPISYIDKILTCLRMDVGITKEKHLKELFDWASKSEVNADKIVLVGLMYREGYSIKDALKEIDDIQVLSFKMPVYRKKYKELKAKHKLSNYDLLRLYLKDGFPAVSRKDFKK